MNERPLIHVTGHRNPDTDSIAAAIGYAELKGRIDASADYVPARLGDVNPQTAWALERAGAPLPELLRHVMLRVRDVMRAEFPIAHVEEPVRSAGRTMVSEGLDLLPVVDDEGKLVGVLTERALAQRYVRSSFAASRLEAPTAVETIAGVLDGTLLQAGAARVAGRVWVLSMSLETMLRDVTDGDIAVIGDRTDAQLEALTSGLAVLVLSNGSTPAPEVAALAAERGVALISTSLDSYVAGRMVTLASPCRALVETDPLTARRDDLVVDIADDIKDADYRAAVVVDAGRIPVGLVTREDLVTPRRRRVILVDHAERGQSVPGIEHAEIVEILDHHHIGSIETRLPVTATFDPVGSTSTLVAERFLAHDLVPSAPTAAMLLSAVLSDTVILNSPTTTDRDRAVVARLADQVGVDPENFGRDLFTAGSDVAGVPASELVVRDAKAYEVGGGQSICIAQIETVGGALEGRTSELLDALAAVRERDGHRLMALMVTDVLAHATELLVTGDLSLAERAFGRDAGSGVIALPDVMSRKKQVAPPLLEAA